jgi:CAAX amino terminal protease family.
MRGLMYNLNPTKAILWSALIFGVMHMNPWQSVPAFLIGILLGWLYWRTRCIWVPIFVHFINNGSSFLIMIFYPDISMDATIRDLIPGNQYYMLYIAAVILLTSIIVLMHKKYDKPVIPAKIPTDT